MSSGLHITPWDLLSDQRLPETVQEVGVPNAFVDQMSTYKGGTGVTARETEAYGSKHPNSSV